MWIVHFPDMRYGASEFHPGAAFVLPIRVKADGAFLRVVIHHFLIFPPVLIGHNQTHVFGMEVVITQFLLTLPFPEVPLDDFESLRAP